MKYKKDNIYTLLKIIMFTLFLVLLFELPLFIKYKGINYYEKNIIDEIKRGRVLENSKVAVNNIFGDNPFKYETVIKIDNDIIISNKKEIYYKTIDKKNVTVKIRNDKNLNSKIIQDVE